MKQEANRPLAIWEQIANFSPSSARFYRVIQLDGAHYVLQPPNADALPFTRARQPGLPAGTYEIEYYDAEKEFSRSDRKP